MRLMASTHPIELEPKNILCSKLTSAVESGAIEFPYETIKVEICCRRLNGNVGVPGVTPIYRG